MVTIRFSSRGMRAGRLLLRMAFRLLQAAILGLSVVDRCFRHVVLPRQFVRLRASLGFLQNPDDLLFYKTSFASSSVLSKGRTPIHRGGRSGGQVKRCLREIADAALAADKPPMSTANANEYRNKLSGLSQNQTL
jgi:hypothetical protein